MASSARARLFNLQKHFQFPVLQRKDSNKKADIGLVKLSDDVSEALSHGRAVVALESTIISHGMPYPQNLQTAKEVEAIVRENGAVPATVAILDGVPCIGLSVEELERLAKLGKKARKTARRDIAHVVATKGDGATTVSATMIFASMVGIPIFVTGGIGGVHRHGETTMDISSDLTELGKTPVAVISAGVKSILDIPRTLEYLETQGVCVAAYKTNEFPAFFKETSGCKAPCRVDTPEDCAQLIDVSIKLKLGTGILIAVPIPKEYSASGSLIESAIQRALKEARDKGITGNAETPFLLARVSELTGGASLASNIALVKNNALLGAKIAVALAQLRERDHQGAMAARRIPVFLYWGGQIVNMVDGPAYDIPHKRTIKLACQTTYNELVTKVCNVLGVTMEQAQLKLKCRFPAYCGVERCTYVIIEVTDDDEVETMLEVVVHYPQVTHVDLFVEIESCQPPLSDYTPCTYGIMSGPYTQMLTQEHSSYLLSPTVAESLVLPETYGHMNMQSNQGNYEAGPSNVVSTSTRDIDITDEQSNDVVRRLVETQPVIARGTPIDNEFINAESPVLPEFDESSQWSPAHEPPAYDVGPSHHMDQESESVPDPYTYSKQPPEPYAEPELPIVWIRNVYVRRGRVPSVVEPPVELRQSNREGRRPRCGTRSHLL